MQIQIKNIRGEGRKEWLKAVSLAILEDLKEKKYSSFSKNVLNSYFNCEDRTKQRLTKEILGVLKENLKVSEDMVFKEVFYFERVALYSYDSGSYSLLMEKNGYSKTAYKWDCSQGFPKRQKVAKGRLKDDFDGSDFDFMEISSHKPYKKQGCYTHSPLSFRRRSFSTKNKIYTIL